jgi:DNA mismatch endonuclease (patch repair protein)
LLQAPRMPLGRKARKGPVDKGAPKGRAGRGRSTPSYAGYSPASPKASRMGRGNRKTGTQPEQLLEGSLRRLGLRFRHHDQHLPGNPDIIFPSNKVAVFCDGSFWHGRNWQERKGKLMRGANADYWVTKISRNRQRDRRVNRQLLILGWHVIRVWDLDVCRDPERVARSIARCVAVRQPHSSRPATRRN